MKVRFDELTPNVQNKILTLLDARLKLKGVGETATEVIARKQPKTRRQWRAYIYHYMNSIDRHRKSLGLEPLYNCDLTLSTGGDKMAIDK